MINRERFLAEFCELVSIDAPSLYEREMADILMSKLTALGFSVYEDKVGDKIGGTCGNLYGYLEGELSLEPVVLVAHMDTVEPAKGKKAVVHNDGRITSDGSTVLGADDVAGIVSILEAVRSIREEGQTHRPIEVLFTVAEELFTAGCSAMEEIKLQSKEAYVLDLSGNVGMAAYRAPSILTFSIQIEGKSAHAGFAPETGIHAIAIAAEIITNMKQGRIDEGTTVNVGTITGGTAFNIVPDQCKFIGEVRGFDHQEARKQLHKIHSLAQTVTNKYGGNLVWNETENCIAYQVDMEWNVVKQYRQVCQKLGIQSEFVSTFGGSDCNVLVGRGIQGLVIANGMNQVHTCEEYSQVEELYRSTKIVEEILINK